MEKIELLKKYVNESHNIVFFGGAGVSTGYPTCIPDFRGEKGLYNQSPEEIISHSYFLSHTKEFYDFYFKKMVYKDALPNNCHYFLAELEKKGKLKAIVTQNIDGLHQAAGSNNVYELHGSVKRNYCMTCHKFYDLDDIRLEGIPKCECGGIIKPDVVLYEEGLDELTLTNAVKAIMNADLMIVAGTSLVVYPAAGLVRYFKGKHLVIINLGVTQYDNEADLVIDGRVEEILSIKNFSD